MTKFFFIWLKNNILEPGKNFDWTIQRRIVDGQGKLTFCEHKNLFAVCDLYLKLIFFRLMFTDDAYFNCIVIIALELIDENLCIPIYWVLNIIMGFKSINSIFEYWNVSYFMN